MQNLYIGINGHVVAIEPSTGRELWRTPLQSGFLSSTSHQDVAVLDVADVVYAGCNGHLFCLDGTDGSIVWESDLKGLGYNDVSLSLMGRTASAKSPERSSSSHSST